MTDKTNIDSIENPAYAHDIATQQIAKMREWLPEGLVEGEKSVNTAPDERIKNLEKMAFTDPKTGYLNVTAFQRVLGDIVKKRLHDESGKSAEPVTIAVIDLNYLKPINNMSYHGCGDVAIKYLADYLSKHLRSGEIGDRRTLDDGKAQPKDLFTRLSNGDEFAVIMKNCTAEQARGRLGEILDKMAEESIGKNNPCIGKDDVDRKFPIQVSAAFGCAQLPDKYPEGMKRTGNPEIDAGDVIDATKHVAAAEEKHDKMRSRKHAASIEGGFPACDDRQNAEKIIGEHLERLARKLNEGKIYKEIKEPSFSDGINLVGSKQITSPEHLQQFMQKGRVY